MATKAPAYLLVSLEAGAEALEAAAVALFDCGADGLIEEETLTGHRLKAYFNREDWPRIKPALEERIERAARYFPSLILVEESSVEDTNWLESWKRFHRPVAVGPLWIGPPWQADQAEPGLIKLIVDPGRAFGTGGHATTRLCLEALVESLAAGKVERMLDLGTGSGVLALAGLKLGAGRALGLDKDPEAIEAAQSNASLNGLADRLELSLEPLAGLKETFLLITANLTGPLLQSLARELIDRLRPGGRLILSGLFLEEIDSLRAAFSPGCRVESVRSLGEWAGLVLTRPDAGPEGG